MQVRNAAKHFSELRAVPESEHEHIVELARYETFVTNNASGRWVFSILVTVVVGVFPAAGFVVTLTFYTGSTPFWLGGVLGGVGAGLFSWWQHRRYVRLLQPAVAKLCNARTT